MATRIVRGEGRWESVGGWIGGKNIQFIMYGIVSLQQTNTRTTTSCMKGS